MKKLLLIVGGILVMNAQVNSQTCFNVGNGTDGGYVASTNTTLAGGTYNFTSFTIDPGVTVTVTGTQPLVVQCTGAVLINGTLSANGGNGNDGITYTAGGNGGIGVAGGANGGNGSFASGSGPIDGTDGIGLGGITTAGKDWSGGGGAGYGTAGNASGGALGGFAGAMYGDANLSGLEVGSGGGGGSGGYDCGAGGGGAGGGLIIIHAGTTLTISATGSITVNGGNGGSDGTGNCGGGGGGSGGSLWLASPSVTHNGSLLAIGGNGGGSAVAGSPYFGVGGVGAVGRIRVDFDGVMNGTGTATPTIGISNTIPVGTLSASSTHTNVTCNTGNDGSATAVATGGSGIYSYSWSPSGGTSNIATGLAAGAYTCSITDGCFFTTTSQTITEPAEITHTNNVDMCPGDFFTVGTSTYTTAGNFVDILTSVDGCDSTVTSNINLLVLPDITTNTTLLTITVSETGATYQWIDCGTVNNAPGISTNQSYTATVNGNYAVIVDNGNCVDTSACINISNVGIVENNQVNQINVYPNPNNGQFIIQSTFSGNFIIQNELGQVVMQINSNNENNHSVSVENLSNGIYFILGENLENPMKIIVTK